MNISLARLRLVAVLAALFSIMLLLPGSSDEIDATVPPSQPCGIDSEDPDQCLQRDVSAYRFFQASQQGASFDSLEETPSVEDVLEKGLKLAGASPVHLAFRGTASKDSVRCEWRGVARTAAQREEAIRFWLGIDADTTLPSPSQAESTFMGYVNQMDPRLRDTMEANFKAISRGGLSTDTLFLSCYANYTLHEYLLGPSVTSTPTIATVYDGLGEGRS